MNHYLSSIHRVCRSSIAPSLTSLFAEKLSLRCYGSLGALRTLSFPQNMQCASKDFSGYQKHNNLMRVFLSHESAEDIRGFSSMSSSWNNMRGNGGAPNASSSTNYIDSSSQKDNETRRNASPMDFVRGIIEREGKDIMGGFRMSQHNVERDADFVHIKMLRNNTFVTVTDSKGNIKLSASAGCFKELKAGQKLSRYAAEATAEEVGRKCRSLGLKSAVMKVNGFTYFKKKRQAIMSWKEGFSGPNPVVYVEDTTRRPHNGCRLPKKRRI